MLGSSDSLFCYSKARQAKLLSSFQSNHPFRNRRSRNTVARRDIRFQINYWRVVERVNLIDQYPSAVYGFDRANGKPDKVGPQRRPGCKNARERVPLVSSRVNPQCRPLFGRVVPVKPVEYNYMGKPIQTKQGVPEIRKDLKSGLVCGLHHSAHRVNRIVFSH